jgi:[acyl-carrier-protein] S-malonyltransferase
MTLAIVFPGQGSQYVGMGSPLKEESFFSRFSEADQALGFSLSNLCLEGPEDQLKLTPFTQPAIVAHSMALWDKLESQLRALAVPVDFVLGHSVGEYAALVAAGVLSYQDAIKAVHTRGKAMQEATPVGVGKMMAILKLDATWVEKACAAVSQVGSAEVMPANYNDPKQIVISGHAEACEAAVKWLETHCPERFSAIALNVSAPFHSSLMLPAEKVMEQVLKRIPFQTNTVAYVANVDAHIYPKGSTASEIRERLVKQVCGSVKWSQSITHLPVDCRFIEVGPGKVLAGLIRRIRPEAKVLSLDTAGSFEKIQEFLT